MKKLAILGVVALLLAMTLAMVAVPALAGKDGPAGKSNTAHLYLCQKDAETWQCVDGGAWGKLEYKLSGPEFEFVFNGKGLEANTEYSLIYYADFKDRMNVWGGDNPGALIATGSSNNGGNIHLSGPVELGMDLPSSPDANIAFYDYSGAPDFYAHAHGAKIWLVPSSDYDADYTKVIAWNPAEYLFETDLITYDDTDVPNIGALLLENKNPATWEILVDGRNGGLVYNLAGDNFDFVFYGRGLEGSTAYSLIYYADFVDRYNVWGGNNPGALIGTGTTTAGGNLTISGSPDLGMDLPSEPDENIDTHDYSGAPDFYANAHGAKIWLVPSDCYDAGNTKVDTWSPDRFLFETDLIWYTDTNKP